MPLLFSQFKELVAPYVGKAGKCPTASETAIFARQVMEYLLLAGSQAGVRKLCIVAHKGCVTLPPEVDVPLKVKIEKRSAETWTKWGSFSSASGSFESYREVGDALIETGEYTPLAYPLPACGSIVGVMAVCEEEPDSYVTIQGNDITGRRIFTSVEGESIPGERFRLVKGQIRHGKVRFGEITAVVKPKTKGYVSVHAVDVENNSQDFLGDYSPFDERPMFRKYRLTTKCGDTANLSILCRVRLRDVYHDHDLTLFDNTIAVVLAAQRLQSEVNYDSAMANYKKQAVDELLDREAGYKKNSGLPVDVFYPLSGGAIRGIV